MSTKYIGKPGEIVWVPEVRCGCCEEDFLGGPDPDDNHLPQTLRRHGWKRTRKYGWTCFDCISR
jgi:Ni,Fe-hydrogenase I small subunit